VWNSIPTDIRSLPFNTCYGEFRYSQLDYDVLFTLHVLISVNRVTAWLFENFLDCSDWLDKSWPSKKNTFILIM